MADDIPTEALEAARAAYAFVAIERGQVGPPRVGHLDAINAAVAAAAPHLIAEGRRQAAEAIRQGTLNFCMDGTGRHLIDTAAEIAEGTDHGQG